MAMEQRLFMIMVGCTPEGRHTEQHDIFFGIGSSLQEMVPQLVAFWPEAKGILHIDAWRELHYVDGYHIKVAARSAADTDTIDTALFFLNLGGYKPGEFDEFHYKMVVAAKDKGSAVQQAKQTAFYKHTGFKGAASHIDDHYGVDVDDVHRVADILPAAAKAQYKIILEPAATTTTDKLHIGYFNLNKVAQGHYDSE
jgi:hypothetical protein